MTGITMDGKLYHVRVIYNTMNRSFALENGVNEDYMLSGYHERDLRGTRYSYEMGIEPHPLYQKDYDDFFDEISAPVDSHTVTLPYGQGVVTFDAEIESGDDTWKGRLAGVDRWSGLKVKFIPISPQRMAYSYQGPQIATAGGGIPTGAIIIWSGTAENIPDGWALCDGEDGRPDLQDKFVLGAGATHSVGDTGGQEEVTLTDSEVPSMNALQNKSPASESWSSSTEYLTGINLSYENNAEPHTNMPPYYALCYIIKTA